MDIALDSITAGYRERIRRIHLFHILHTLEAKQREKDQAGRELDYFSVGMAVLLFFFEKKLLRQTKVGVLDVAQFLQRFFGQDYDFSGEQYEKMAAAVIETLRPSNGTRPQKPFYNIETKKIETVEYTYLLASGHDKWSNRQFYTLSDTGLELVFSTREFFSEFQLSISQLMLRKQLEKGQFHSALRQISEMDIAVEQIRNRMEQLKRKLKSNILSDETLNRYKEIIEDIHIRLQYESEEFQELEQFISETRKRLSVNMENGKAEQAYEFIVRIARELSETHEKHKQLFKESIELKRTALEVAQESLYSAAVSSFSFQRDIVTYTVATPLDIENVRYTLLPFLGLEQKKNWSPLTLFAPQRREKEEEQIRTAFEEMGEEKVEQQKQQLARMYHDMMKTLLLSIERTGKGRLTLDAFVESLRGGERAGWLDTRLFYHFLLLLHQRSPLTDEKKEAGEFHIFDSAVSLLQGKRLWVQEEEGVCEATEQFQIQNMTFTLEGIDDV